MRTAAAPNKRLAAKPSIGVDDAKTFEFKSFKKLREETCHKLYTHQVSKEGRNLKTHDTSEVMEEFNNTNRCNYNMSDSSLPMLNGTPFFQRSFHSPSKVLQNHELNDKITCNFEVNDPLFPIRNAPLNVQRYSPSRALASHNCEPEWKHEGIFSKKRGGLLHLAAKASSLQVNEFLSKRSELIPKFLQRLTSVKITSDGNVLPKPVQRNSNGSYDLHMSSKSDDLLEDLHDTSGMRLSAATVQKNLGSEFLAHSCKEADDPILPAWDIAKTHASPFWPSSRPCQLVASSKFGGYSKDDSHEIIVTGPFATTPSGYLGNKLHSDNYKKVDEAILSAIDSVDDHNFSSRHIPETTIQCNRWPSKWVSGSRELSDLHSEYESISAVKLREYGCHSVDRLLTDVDFLDHDNSLSHCHYIEQALVPYKKSSSVDSFDVSSPEFSESAREHCGLPLLGWGIDIKEGSELGVSYERMVPADLDHLPLALYSTPNFLDQTKNYDFVNVCEKGKKFSSLKSMSDVTDWYTPCQNPEGIIRSRLGFQLEWKSSPFYLDGDHSSFFYTN